MWSVILSTDDGLHKPRVATWRAALPWVNQLARGRDHDAAASAARKLVSRYTGLELACLLAAQLPGDIVFVFPAPAQWLNGSQQWTKVADLACQFEAELAGYAVVAVYTHVSAPEGNGPELAAWQEAQQRGLLDVGVTGAGPPAARAARQLPPGRQWSPHRRRLELQAREATVLVQVRQSLEEAIECGRLAGDDQATLDKAGSWFEAIRPTPWAEVPEGLLHSSYDYGDERVGDCCFPEPCPPIVTTRLPRAPAQAPYDGPPPPDMATLMGLSGPEEVREWARPAVDYLRDIEARGTGAVRHGSEPAIIAKEDHDAAAVGRVWQQFDASKPPVLLDLRPRRIPTHLNVDYIARRMRGDPDQEIAGFLEHGAQLKTPELEDAGHTAVYPPLLSMAVPGSLTSFQDGVRDAEARGWCVIGDQPMTVPFRAASHGATDKADGTRRVCKDEGCPRKRTLDSRGEEVLSLNEASGGKVSQKVVHARKVARRVEAVAAENAGRPPPPPARKRVVKFPPEKKALVKHVTQALAVMAHVATLLETTPVLAGDDFKAFFNQIPLDPREYAKCGKVLVLDGQVKFVTELSLAFGQTPASGIAQRVSDCILRWHAEDFAKAVRPLVATLRVRYPRFDAWLRQRAELGLGQDLMLWEGVYTDDSSFVVPAPCFVGPAVYSWVKVLVRSGFLDAPPAKKHLGCHMQWNGALLNSLLVAVWLPGGKVLRTLLQLREALEGRMTNAEWRSLRGMLNHASFLLLAERRESYDIGAVDGCRNVSWAEEPNAVRRFSAAAKECLRSWQDKLASTTGVPALVATPAFGRSAPDRVSVAFTIAADAFRGGGKAGLGTFSGGLCVHHEVQPPYHELPTAVHELIASVMAIVAYAPAIASLGRGDTHMVHLRSDAMATPRVLTSDAAKSPMMVAVHKRALRESVYTDAAVGVLVSHLYGLGNEFSDHVSRLALLGYDERLRRLAGQAGVKLKFLPAPAAFIAELYAAAWAARDGY